MKKMLLTPEEGNYTVLDGIETISAQLDGGQGRYRQDIQNASLTVTCTWICTRAEYEYLRAFYKGSAAARASQTFLIDLIVDQAFGLTEHKANFVPGKFKVSQVKGHSFKIDATLEVRPVIYEDGYYDAIVYLYEEFGEDQQAAADLFNQLHLLMNVQLPAIPVFQG